MSLLTSDHAFEVCEAALAASPADETEVTLESEEDRFVRYGPEGPSQNGDRERHCLSLRLRYSSPEGWREARATVGNLSEDSVRAALQRADLLAQVAAPDPYRVELGGAVEVAGSALHRPTQDHTFREKARWIEAAMEACAQEGLVPAGLARTTVRSRHLVNSAGRRIEGAISRASFSLTATPEDGASDGGVAEQTDCDVGRLDPARVVARAVEKGATGRAPRAVPAGEYTVVLEPLAVSSLLLFLSYQGLGAKEVHEQRSLLVDRQGVELFPRSLSLCDDAGLAEHPGWRFDGEGAPRHRVSLLENGALRAPVTDSVWAARLGVANTGHGHAQPSAEGPSPENLCMAAGDASLEDLVAGVDRGLLVTRFHYTNLIEPRDVTLTGMTRGGTFLIEGGRVTAPVCNLRFTQSLVEALQRVTGVGHRAEVAGALFRGEIVCPALRIEGFRFTSTTEL
jgi:PmbA protein